MRKWGERGRRKVVDSCVDKERRKKNRENLKNKQKQFNTKKMTWQSFYQIKA
jgi:hypothetical protein